MPSSPLVDVARTFLGECSSLHYAPEIPGRKLAGARETHPALAGPAEIVLLYDDTLFGSATEGFVCTSEALYWKYVLAPARRVCWRDLQGDAIHAANGELTIGENRLWLTNGLRPEDVAAFLVEAARLQRAESIGPYRDGIASTPAARITGMFRRQASSSRYVFVAPNIPPAKERRARAAHAAHLPVSEPILVLCDTTFFGGGENGFVITETQLCWKRLGEAPKRIEWAALAPRDVITDQRGLLVRDQPLPTLDDPRDLPTLAAAFADLAQRSR